MKTRRELVVRTDALDQSVCGGKGGGRAIIVRLHSSGKDTSPKHCTT
jgi:hypothetical protein